MRNAEASALGELAPMAEGLSLGIEFPLVVDLDGTLIATDALHESLLFFLKRQGMASWKIPFWILSGRAKVKNRLAAVVTEEDVATFPVNDELLAMAEREAKRGRRVVLATAADLSIAEKVQRRFPCINDIVASRDGLNLKGLAKAQELVSLLPDGFVYAGDSSADLHVWSKASAAVFAGRSARMVKKVTARTELVSVLPTKGFNFPSLRRGLRFHQWAKNALVFVPLGARRKGA